jgi:predicted nucleic acid-binding protein
MDYQLPKDEVEHELRWMLCLERLFEVCRVYVDRRDLDPLLLDRAAEAREAWAEDLFDEERREEILHRVCEVLEATEVG